MMLRGTGTLGSGSSTNDPRPQLTGTAEAGSTVTIYDNGIAIGTAIVGSNGSWSFTPSVNLSEGSHQLTVRATDVAGNTGPASPVFTVTVDVTAPQTPSGFIINDDTGVLKGAIGAGQFTDASEPRLTGRGEPGSTITVYDNGVVIGTTTVLPNGTEHHADESTGRRRTLDYPAGNRCGRQPERSVSADQLYRRSYAARHAGCDAQLRRHPDHRYRRAGQ